MVYKSIIGAVCACLAVVSFNVNAATFLAPIPYLSTADSPFIDQPGSPFSTSDLGSTFYLEDFEDGTLETGVTATVKPDGTWSDVCTTTDAICGTADSVDGDDGVIDGSGSDGYTYHVSSAGDGAVLFEFDSSIFGFNPTHVGVVWTDGFPTPITFEAFDINGISLGTSSTTVAITGGTAEDRFFGVISYDGISAIRLSSQISGGIEADHLQWGYSPVPIPAAVWLFGSGLIGLVGLARRKANA